MISKEDFCKSIEKYKEILLKADELYKLGIRLDIVNDYECLIHNILEDTFKDESDWFCYFCFDLDFGRKYKDGMITDSDGNNISMNNAEELYEILMENLLQKVVGATDLEPQRKNL